MSESVHLRTPTLLVHDSRSLAVRQVAYLRAVAGDPVETLITRQRHDAAGRLVEQWDPRLSVPNVVTVFRLDGQPLKVDSVDAGKSLVLPGLAGEERLHWDALGNHRRKSYDNQMRPVTIEENAVPEVETLTYADATAAPGHNLRGQMIALKDRSGTVDFRSFALTGPALGETRTFHDGKAFVSSHTFSPLGEILEKTDAGGHQRQSIYNVAGQLRQVKLQLKDQPDWQTVLEDAQYNAAGQIIEQKTGNGVISRWLYDPADGRLHRQIAQKDPTTVLQDLEYRYDPMGNVIAILDHAFTPSFFANQRVDGDRTFTYDSLYRLRSATGYADAPPADDTSPLPTDPNDRRNYTETNEYDAGDNLIKTIHVREGTSHTREMFIDSASNRGVRWKPGDPQPDLDTLFDRAGNLLALQPGQPMHWNNRGQLESVTLVDRNGSGPNDEERYAYSQGERVHKRHETHTTKVSHFHDVRYLPGLEIRTKDNGEELHVITLDIGPGGVRCLHWEKDPANIGADQLRYILNDHLGSAVKEFDGQAKLISDEGYLPFGETAYLTARSAVEVSYRTVRYSGKEMDVSGLYYYGARYYAPWLGRWISADPAGDVDGLNLYAFVGNNPLRYVDSSGFSKTEAERRQEIGAFVENLSSATKAVDKQNALLEHAFETKAINLTIAKTKTFAIATGIVSYGAGVAGGFAGGLAGTVTVPVAGTITLGTLGALGAKKAAGKFMEKVGKAANLEPSITPKAAELSWEKIKKKNVPILSVEYAKNLLHEYNPKTSEGQKTWFKEVVLQAMGRLVKFGAKELVQLGKLSEEANDISELSPMKINRLNDAYAKLGEDVTADYDQVMENFSVLGTPSLYSTGGVTGSEELIELKTIKKDMEIFRAKTRRAQETIVRYRQRQGWPTRA
ncbi:RHS repeat-associated core domain-containing protein [Pseudomonas frederiksbergensis]|uniref:RHS repeat-associated core domain-containing protein n=1 Tax=Pseudomonas frederiksbergensis TaxID=104087 RepID=UPI00197F43EF|nr:RHS repeat-associated core domain-containing protein [Pseudomonas frederiksbergensis]MBN3863879.1 RHS repeat-associated core domain-containing protein [Pseudomonas frederiksbergensis]